MLVEADVFNSLIGDQRHTSHFAASLWDDAGTLLGVNGSFIYKVQITFLFSFKYTLYKMPPELLAFL